MKSDRELQHDIEQELLWTPSLDARNVKVAVHGRVATLAGSVADQQQKAVVRAVARRVADCRAVVTELVVRAPYVSHNDAAALTAAVRSALAWQKDLPCDAVHAVVDLGCVTLTGEVEDVAQAQAAESIVSRMRGVLGVVNLIRIRAPSAHPDISAHIAHALADRASSEAAAIHVNERDGVVRLTGTVGSLREKEQVEQAAWTTQGVKWVINQLDVA